jgi:carbon-monoxide dehydrogenase medium subunit
VQIPAPFDYARAESVDHALALLEQHGPEARVVAGGHSLLPMMKLRLARPDCLVDINDLFELDFLVEDAGTLRIGALTRHTTLLESELVGRLFPIVHDAERVIADPGRAQPRHDRRLACARPTRPRTCPPSATCCRAQAVVRGPSGERTLTMAELHRGPYETRSPERAADRGALPVRPRSGSAYEKVERRVGDWAVAAAGAAVTLGEDNRIEDVAVGLTALGWTGRSTARRSVCRGSCRPRTATPRRAASPPRTASPVADQRGPVDYKRHLANELTRRVLRTACARAARADDRKV